MYGSCLRHLYLMYAAVTTHVFAHQLMSATLIAIMRSSTQKCTNKYSVDRLILKQGTAHGNIANVSGSCSGSDINAAGMHDVCSICVGRFQILGTGN